MSEQLELDFVTRFSGDDIYRALRGGPKTLSTVSVSKHEVDDWAKKQGLVEFIIEYENSTVYRRLLKNGNYMRKKI